MQKTQVRTPRPRLYRGIVSLKLTLPSLRVVANER
jgi:hypothetical protein